MTLYIIAIIISFGILSIILELLFPRQLLLNDVTTTPENPPHYREIQNLPANQSRDMSFNHKAYDFNKKYYNYLHPLELKIPMAAAFKRAQQVIRETLRWTIVSENEREMYLEVIAKTPLFGFRDDVVIEIRTSSDGSSIIHVRSKSRSGLGDLGINARRISVFIEAMKS